LRSFFDCNYDLHKAATLQLLAESVSSWTGVGGMYYLIGLILGILIGTTGVGGGTITAPILILVMGFPVKIAVGTALLFSAVLKIFASCLYMLKRLVNLRVLAYLVAGGLPGAMVGAVVLEELHSSRMNALTMMSVGLIVMISGICSLWRTRKMISVATQRLRLLPVFTFPIGIETGFSSAGAGAMGTLLLLNLSSLAPSVIVGTDLVFGFTLSTVAGGIHAISGSCDWYVLKRLLMGGIVGSAFGFRLSSTLSTTVLRTILLVCSTIIGGLVLGRGIVNW
jgi:uncharacterized protein